MSVPIPTGNVYDKYATRHPLERRLVQGFLRSLAQALPSRTPARVVEVGMGEGEIAELVRTKFPDASILGVDLPDVALAGEWKARNLTGLFADAMHLPFADGSVDLVLATEVLEHVPDPEQVLDEMVRIASGTLVLSVPREPIWRIGNVLRLRYLRRWGNTPGHLQHWSRKGFVRFVSRHARVAAVYSPVPWTLVVAAPRATGAG